MAKYGNTQKVIANEKSNSASASSNSKKTTSASSVKSTSTVSTTNTTKKLGTKDFMAKYGNTQQVIANEKKNTIANTTTSKTNNKTNNTGYTNNGKYSNLPNGKQTTNTNESKSNNWLTRFEDNYKTTKAIESKGVDTGERMGKSVKGALQGEVGAVTAFGAKNALNNSGMSAEEMIDYNQNMPKDKWEKLMKSERKHQWKISRKSISKYGRRR